MTFFDRDALELSLRELKGKLKTPLFRALLGLFIGFPIGTFFYGTSISQAIDVSLQRPMFELRGTRSVPPEVIIVAIDDYAFKQLKQPSYFPLPRHYMATAFEEIASASPKVFILDGKIDPYPCSDLGSDERIALALSQMQSTLWSGKEPEVEDDPFTKEIFPSDEKFRRAVKFELPMALLGVGGKKCFICSGGSADSPLEEKIPILRALTELGKITVPREPGDLDYINFYGPHLTIPRISIYDFIKGDKEKAKALIKDKIVLFGVQSLALDKGPWRSERFFTPVSARPMFGVEIHANVVGNLMDGSFLRRLPLQYEQFILSFLISLLIAIPLYHPNWKSLLIIGGVGVGALIASYVGFARYNFWFGGITTLILSALLTIVVCGMYFAIGRGRFNNKVKRVLGLDVEDIKL